MYNRVYVCFILMIWTMSVISIHFFYMFIAASGLLSGAGTKGNTAFFLSVFLLLNIIVVIIISQFLITDDGIIIVIIISITCIVVVITICIFILNNLYRYHNHQYPSSLSAPLNPYFRNIGHLTRHYHNYRKHHIDIMSITIIKYNFFCTLPYLKDKWKFCRNALSQIKNRRYFIMRISHTVYIAYCRYSIVRRSHIADIISCANRFCIML